MVYEFAIEPDLVATWGTLPKYRYFMDNFGLGTPRIMSEFPKLKNWRRRVLQAASGREGLEMQRITAMVNYLGEILVKRDEAAYDGLYPGLTMPKKNTAISLFMPFWPPAGEAKMTACSLKMIFSGKTVIFGTCGKKRVISRAGAGYGASCLCFAEQLQ